MKGKGSVAGKACLPLHSQPSRSSSPPSSCLVACSNSLVMAAMVATEIGPGFFSMSANRWSLSAMSYEYSVSASSIMLGRPLALLLFISRRASAQSSALWISHLPRGIPNLRNNHLSPSDISPFTLTSLGSAVNCLSSCNWCCLASMTGSVYHMVLCGVIIVGTNGFSSNCDTLYLRIISMGLEYISDNVQNDVSSGESSPGITSKCLTISTSNDMLAVCSKVMVIVWHLPRS